MINVDDVYGLLEDEESPVIEFKREWYWDDHTPAQEMQRKWGEFIKDFISLTNGYIEYCGTDRYLIIGYCENERKIYSVTRDSTKKLHDLRAFKKEIVAKLERAAITPILNFDISFVVIDSQSLLVFKIPSPTSVVELRNELLTKTITIQSGVVLVRKGQDEDSIRAAGPREIELLSKQFASYKLKQENEKIKLDLKRDRSISSTVNLYIDKNRSYVIDEGYPVPHRDWSENVLFELYRISEPLSGKKYFLYIHEKASQNKTFEYLKVNKLLEANIPLIILTEKPSDIKDLDRRKGNLKTRFRTEFVYFIDEFGYKNLYSEHMLEYEPYRVPNYVDSLSASSIAAIDQLKAWYDAISNPLMVIKGYGGIGKTTLVKQFLDYIHGTTQDIGILFIDSNEIIDELLRVASRTDHRIDDIYDFYIAQMKSEDYDGVGFSKELLKLSVDNGNLLIVLDGIDEVIAKLGTNFDVSAFLHSIATSYSTNLERTKVVITCRDYFWDSLHDKVKVEEISLEPFNEELARKFFAKYFSDDQGKITKAMAMAADFRIKNRELDDEPIFIPYVLDMVAYLIKQKASSGDSPSGYIPKSTLLNADVSNDFLVASVCEREVAKLHSLSVDTQIQFLINLAISGEEYVTDYNIKYLLNENPEAVEDSLVEKIKGHPLLSNSGNRVYFRYDFFHEYFKCLYIYRYFSLRDTTSIDDNFITIIGSYLKYGNEFCDALCSKMEYSMELLLFSIETIEVLREKLLNGEPGDRNPFNFAISSIFMLLVSLIRDSDDIKFDIPSCTQLLKDVFEKNNELVGIALVHVPVSDIRKPIFDFRNTTVKDAYFERYDYFWDCLIDEDTRFFNSSFRQLVPRKSLKPSVYPSTFSGDCDIDDIKDIIAEREEEITHHEDRIKDNLVKLFDLFYKRGNFYPRKYDQVISKLFTGPLLPTLMKNKVIEYYPDPKKPTIKQLRVCEKYRAITKHIEQKGASAELEEVLAMFS